MEEVAAADEEEAKQRAAVRAEVEAAGKTIKSTTEKSWESAKRKQKRLDEEKEKMNLMYLQKDRNTDKKKHRAAEALSVKRSRAVRAVGGLDQDFDHWGMGARSSRDKLSKKAMPEEIFRDYDPEATELRKGGKKGKHSFKSKSKFKRRKKK